MMGASDSGVLLFGRKFNNITLKIILEIKAFKHIFLRDLHFMRKHIQYLL